MSARPGSGGPDVHRANEPTASLMSVQVQNLHASDYHLIDGERGKTMLLRSARTIWDRPGRGFRRAGVGTAVGR